jgi:hypothetical protein
MLDAGHDAGVDGGPNDAGTDAGADAGYDAGYDAGLDGGYDGGFDAGFDAGDDGGMRDGGCMPTGICTPYVNACGENCGCLHSLMPDAGEIPYCDPDIGNPCPLGCFNAKQADGGREYYDSGMAVCFC